MALVKCIAALFALTALPAGAEAAGPLKLAEISARLYDLGREDRDALVVATAAKLRKEAGLSADLPLDWQAMLAEAETLAAGDAALLELIGDIRAKTAKGVISGAIQHLSVLAAGASDTRPAMEFRGGEYAEVYVEAPPGVDLNLTVLDAGGHVVCTDADKSHIAYCGWTPATDGEFILVIENAGALPADYALLTN